MLRMLGCLGKGRQTWPTSAMDWQPSGPDRGAPGGWGAGQPSAASTAVFWGGGGGNKPSWANPEDRMQLLGHQVSFGPHGLAALAEHTYVRVPLR